MCIRNMNTGRVFIFLNDGGIPWIRAEEIGTGKVIRIKVNDNDSQNRAWEGREYFYENDPDRVYEGKFIPLSPKESNRYYDYWKIRQDKQKEYDEKHIPLENKFQSEVSKAAQKAISKIDKKLPKHPVGEEVKYRINFFWKQQKWSFVTQDEIPKNFNESVADKVYEHYKKYGFRVNHWEGIFMTSRQFVGITLP